MGWTARKAVLGSVREREIAAEMKATPQLRSCLEIRSSGFAQVMLPKAEKETVLIQTALPQEGVMYWVVPAEC